MKKLLLTLFISTFAFFAVLWGVDLLLPVSLPKADYGITFSTSYTRELGLSPGVLYQALIDDLGVKKIRLPVYWDEVEVAPGQFDFSEIDSLLKKSQGKDVQIIMAIGYKVPRWPECYPPAWAKNFSKRETQKSILELIKNTVDHFKGNPKIIAWQVENEPLFGFGVCHSMDKNFLKEEINLVRSKDKRPIVLTDAGELSLWTDTMQLSDVLGTTLYRTVWNPRFGFFRYPLPPSFYRLKGLINQKIFASNSSGILISELQTEPWAPGKPLTKTPLLEQIKIFSPKEFQNIVSFAKKTGIKEQYLWGAEWWYWMKLQGYPQYWEYAKSVISN